MNSRIIKILGCGLILTSVSMLAGCNTVKGTVQGAGQDIQAVGTAVAPSSKPKVHKKYRKHKKSKVTKAKSTTVDTSDKSKVEDQTKVTNDQDKMKVDETDQTKTDLTTSTDDHQPIEKDTTKTEETY